MNTTFFKYAIEVERTRSITQAAQNLFMAQPNLSKAIKEMEESLGFQIFKRTSRGVIPTEKGQEFLAYARSIAAQLDKIEALSHTKKQGTQRFNISIPRGSYISAAFTRFVSRLNRSEAIELNLQETNAMTTINEVASGEFQLGIIRYQTVYERYFLDFLRSKQLGYEPVWDFEYLTLMSCRHPLANENRIEYKALEKYIEIIHGDTAIPYLSAGGEHPHTVNGGDKKIVLYERCNQFELLSNITDTYMWVSPVPKDYLTRYNLTQRKCEGSGNRCRDILIYGKGYRFTELDTRFIQKLLEAKQEVAQQE